MKFYRLSDATIYDSNNTIYQFSKPCLENEMPIFEEYGAFKRNSISQDTRTSNTDIMIK